MEMEKVYAVYRDGFRLSGFVDLATVRASIAHYRSGKDFYDLSIYMKNDDGSLTWIE